MKLLQFEPWRQVDEAAERATRDGQYLIRLAPWGDFHRVTIYAVSGTRRRPLEDRLLDSTSSSKAREEAVKLACLYLRGDKFALSQSDSRQYHA